MLLTSGLSWHFLEKCVHVCVCLLSLYFLALQWHRLYILVFSFNNVSLWLQLHSTHFVGVTLAYSNSPQLMGIWVLPSLLLLQKCCNKYPSSPITIYLSSTLIRTFGLFQIFSFIKQSMISILPHTTLVILLDWKLPESVLFHFIPEIYITESSTIWKHSELTD